MATKRQTTMAKLQRERKVQEKREKKLEKKAAAKLAAANGELPEEPLEDELPPDLNDPRLYRDA